jgi:plastocyanin
MTRKGTLAALWVVAVTAVVVLSFAVGAGAQERVIYVALVEPKGGVTVDKEPYPAGDLPQGGGYVKKAPDDKGRWEVSVYQFAPATIVVKQGERVTLEMFGINGAKHTVHIDKYHPDHVVAKRGEITRIRFTADTPGLFKIHCKEHEPSMEGLLVVLPR